MKILLINPPDKNTIVADNPEFLDEQRGVNPPLGILYLAAYLRKHSSHNVEVLDAMVEGIEYDKLKDIVAEKNPDVVGITAMTFTLIDVMKTVGIVKEASGDIKIVLGGPHATIYPMETIKLPGVDCVVKKEGEIVFSKLMDNWGNIGQMKQIKGIVFKNEKGDIIDTGENEFITNIDELPFPARDLVPYTKYTSVLSRKPFITTMFTSRGCPFQCSFCDRPHMGRQFRARSSTSVVDEMQACHDMGIKEILIYDDTFAIDKKRVMKICDDILNRKLDVTWDIRTRVDTVDEEMLRKLKQAGCERIHYGVEAGTDKILKKLKKGVTLKLVEDIFKLTKRIGISTLAYFMIGSPTETREDILKTIDFSKKIAPDYVHITITTPFPATELYEWALEENVIIEDYWKKFAEDPSKGVVSRYWEKELKKEELFSLLNYAYKSFYIRPSYMLSKFLKIRSFTDLVDNVSKGAKLAKAVLRGS